MVLLLNAVPETDKDWVVYFLMALVGLLFVAGVGLFTWAVNSFTKRMDKHEGILTEYIPKLKEHEMKIGYIEKKLDENIKWTNLHDKRLQDIERGLKHT